MAQLNTAVNPAETEILRSFRSYGVKAHEMLFFNRNSGKAHSPKFTAAMQSMVDRGLVVRDNRHRDAYSLSDTGYQAVRAIK
jgi:hypothetical protein